MDFTVLDYIRALTTLIEALLWKLCMCPLCSHFMCCFLGECYYQLTEDTNIATISETSKLNDNFFFRVGNTFQGHKNITCICIGFQVLFFGHEFTVMLVKHFTTSTN